MSRGLRILVGSGVVMSMSVSSLGVSQSRLEDQERFWRSMGGKHRSRGRDSGIDAISSTSGTA